MKAEKIILSFVAILVGLIAAGVAFYFYQMTKTLPSQKSQPLAVAPKTTPTPVPDTGNYLTLDSPKEEGVFNTQVINVSGKTAKDATIIVTSENGDDVVKPATNGDFTLTSTIPDGTSLLLVTAVFSNGEEKRVSRTVTFSTESF